MALELVALGVGAGSTHTYTGECSSSFMLCLDGTPILMLDVGLGAVRAALQICGSLPQHIYISHNHTDHAGELPVLLAVEAAAGRRRTVLAEAAVLHMLQEHRLAELRSTGQNLSWFAELQACDAGKLHHLPCGSALQPLQSRHAERCFGLLVHWQGRPVLGWTGDSGCSLELYSQLAAAPMVLLDGRAVGSKEHAGFDELQAAAADGVLSQAQCYVYGYGQVDHAPDSTCYPALTTLKPGSRMMVAKSQQGCDLTGCCAQAAGPTVDE